MPCMQSSKILLRNESNRLLNLKREQYKGKKHLIFLPKDNSKGEKHG